MSFQLPRLTLTGALSSQGQPYRGVREAPLSLRQEGLSEALESSGLQVVDCGDVGASQIPVEAHSDEKWSAYAEFARQLAGHVRHCAEYHPANLVLGGDHSVSAGSVAGFLQARPALSVIWVDAHGDLNTPDTTLTGNYHGMPLGVLLGLLSRRNQKEFGWMEAQLDPRRLVLIGIRSLDPCEHDIIRRLGILVFAAADVQRLGVSEVMKRSLEHLDRLGLGPLHLSFDIDALDPSVAPSTGTPAREGLTLTQGLEICRWAARASSSSSSSAFFSMDIVEVNPQLFGRFNETRKTLNAAISLAQTSFESACVPQ